MGKDKFHNILGEINERLNIFGGEGINVKQTSGGNFHLIFSLLRSKQILAMMVTSQLTHHGVEEWLNRPFRFRKLIKRWWICWWNKVRIALAVEACKTKPNQKCGQFVKVVKAIYSLLKQNENCWQLVSAQLSEQLTACESCESCGQLVNSL